MCSWFLWNFRFFHLDHFFLFWRISFSLEFSLLGFSVVNSQLYCLKPISLSLIDISLGIKLWAGSIFVVTGRNNSTLFWFPLLLLINWLPNSSSLKWMCPFFFLKPLAAFEVFSFSFLKFCMLCLGIGFLFICPGWDFYCKLLIFPGKSIYGSFLEPKK